MNKYIKLFFFISLTIYIMTDSIVFAEETAPSFFKKKGEEKSNNAVNENAPPVPEEKASGTPNTAQKDEYKAQDPSINNENKATTSKSSEIDQSKPPKNKTIVKNDSIVSEDEIIKFINKRISLSQKNNVSDILDCYADKVTLNGISENRASLRKKIQSDIDRYSMRIQSLNSDIIITPGIKKGTKKVIFGTTFSMKDNINNNIIKGSLNKIMIVSISSKSPKIVEETTAIVSVSN